MTSLLSVLFALGALVLIAALVLLVIETVHE